MLNHMIAWNGWIFGPKKNEAHLAHHTKSEFATFERMVLKASPVKLVQPETIKN